MLFFAAHLGYVLLLELSLVCIAVGLFLVFLPALLFAALFARTPFPPLLRLPPLPVLLPLPPFDLARRFSFFSGAAGSWLLLCGHSQSLA